MVRADQALTSEQSDAGLMDSGHFVLTLAGYYIPGLQLWRFTLFDRQRFEADFPKRWRDRNLTRKVSIPDVGGNIRKPARRKSLTVGFGTLCWPAAWLMVELPSFLYHRFVGLQAL